MDAPLDPCNNKVNHQVRREKGQEEEEEEEVEEVEEEEVEVCLPLDMITPPPVVQVPPPRGVEIVIIFAMLIRKRN